MPVIFLRFALLAALASYVAAQSQQPRAILGYGGYPCTSFDTNNNPIANQNTCNSLRQPSNGGTAPIGAECVMEPETGFYFCGIEGAACTVNTNCDYGTCNGGKCAGGPGDVSSSGLDGCLGLLFLNDDQVCGGVGALCNSGGAGTIFGNVATPSVRFDTICASGFCGITTCHAAVNPGDACLTDDSRVCGPSLYAWRNHATGACTCESTPPPAASQRARARRTLGYLCPTSYTACAIGTGFECVDTQTNLERCGGCNEELGAIDCTGLPGVEAVGCVNGQCEIWACTAGYDFNAESGVCRTA